MALIRNTTWFNLSSQQFTPNNCMGRLIAWPPLWKMVAKFLWSWTTRPKLGPPRSGAVAGSIPGPQLGAWDLAREQKVWGPVAPQIPRLSLPRLPSGGLGGRVTPLTDLGLDANGDTLSIQGCRGRFREHLGALQRAPGGAPWHLAAADFRSRVCIYLLGPSALCRNSHPCGPLLRPMPGTR